MTIVLHVGWIAMFFGGVVSILGGEVTAVPAYVAAALGFQILLEGRDA